MTPSKPPTDVGRTRPPTSAFPLLSSPFRLGPLTLRNRVVLLPTGTGYTNRGRVEAEDVAYYVRRASGGVGLIITGGTAAHPSSQTRNRIFIEAYDPEVVPSLLRRSEAVHALGAGIVGQLFNLGRHMPAEVAAGAPVAPSPMRSHLWPSAPVAMTTAHIRDEVEAFALSARHMIEGGYDGVEVHGAHGYLLAQFLSHATNRRDDLYGGPLANRARFLLEVIVAVRRAVGPDPIVGLRLSADDEQAGGIGVEECTETLALVEARAELSYVSLAVGVRGGYVKDSSVAEGVALERIAAIKASTALPVIASQRLRHPAVAEAALGAGSADLIGLARALIADPDWAAKATAGRAESIRLCVGDLQECRNHLSGGLACMVNPEVGRQGTYDTLSRRAGRARGAALVVGGGPAGLESARRLASAGYGVELREAGHHLGGQLRAGARATGRAELADLTDFLAGALGELSVEVVLDAPVGPGELAEVSADVVVFATGARGGPVAALPSAGDDAVATNSLWRLVTEDELPAGDEVVIIDGGSGEWLSVTAADLLARTGRRVTILTSGASPFSAVPHESLAGLVERLREIGVRWQGGVGDLASGGGRVRYTHLGTGREDEVAADLVVLDTGRLPVDELWREAASALPSAARWYAIGDGLTPRGVGHAMSDALEVELDVLSRRGPRRDFTQSERHFTGARA